jgi:hypothetical protein
MPRGVPYSDRLLVAAVPAAAVLRRRAVTGGDVLLPSGLVQRVLHIAGLVAVDGVRPGLMEGPHQLQARLLHDPPRGLVDRHRLRGHPLHAGLGEALADQRA